PQAVPLGFVVARLPVVNRITEWVLPRSVVAQSVASVYGDPARVTPELVDRYFELTLREGNRRALGQRLQAMVVDEGAEQLTRITQPTLVLWGGRDRLVPPSVAQVFKQQIAGSRLVVFDELGHVPHEEDPARTVAPVKELLRSLN
ncbi:MAG TPA: alpha/beta hydrolase, partial [Rubrivivax sp.]|nr:alpha/beta hydrolase [Rubrivivax sp.]